MLLLTLGKRTLVAVLVAIFCFFVGVFPSFADSQSEPFNSLNLHLIGVVEAEGRPKALISMSGFEGEMLVGEGDLIEGYTVSEIDEEQIALVRGQSRESVTLGNFPRLKADMSAKVYSVAYKGPNTFFPTRTSKIASVTQKKTYGSNSKYKVESGSRPKFIRPIRGGWISSYFGPRRTRKVRKRDYYGVRGSRFHKGVDIAAPHGATVYAAADGVVKVSSLVSRQPLGRHIEISHDGSYETSYAHLSRVYVSKGQKVKAGQPIGAEGNTGLSTGAHLHFEIRRKGQAMDPGLFIRSLRKR